MNTVFFDSKMSDEARRQSLYDGQLFVYSPTPSSLELCRFAREMAEEAFRPRDPEFAQFSLPVEQYVAILAALKPRFIHHPRCKELLPRILGELGCDLEKTYFDVPRLRTSTHGGYLTSGIAYAFAPHRDTWHSAPMCQINWWIPVYEIESANGMAFHVHYWSRPVPNGSAGYNYAEWNRESRWNAARHVKTDTRNWPLPEAPLQPDPQLRPICPPGGIVVFSAGHLHSTVPNASGRTRFSIDFRTVHLEDAMMGTGAINVDSAATGTTMGDYLRCTDLRHLPPELIERYDAGNVAKLGASASNDGRSAGGDGLPIAPGSASP
jgi:hypothetical protein